MKLSTPRWWYRRDRRRAMPITRALLTPLSWLWAAATARRIARGKPADVGAPVICVGNLTMGGAGKTPVARAIAAQLAANGRKAHLLSRGYGGSLEGPVRVDLALHGAGEVGDEPLMLAQDFPVWVSHDRAAGARAAAAGGAEIVVMDDGHQNPSVAKALSIVVVDAETRDDEWPFGDGAVFPAGPMREPLKTGLARADAVILLRPADLTQTDAALLRALAGPELLEASLTPAQAAPDGPVFGFAGVGKPWKVERGLQAAGCDLADFAPFPDHFAYDEATLRRLADRAQHLGARLITTEKDWARLPTAWRDKVICWRVAARFDDPAALNRLLDV